MTAEPDPAQHIHLKKTNPFFISDRLKGLYIEDPQVVDQDVQIWNAFRDADLLAEALDEGFRERRELRESLAEYQRRRDAAAMPMLRKHLRARPHAAVSA
jgi:hypothetical protein